MRPGAIGSGVESGSAVAPIEVFVAPTDGSELAELGAGVAGHLAERLQATVRRFSATTDDVVGAIIKEFWQSENAVLCMATHEGRRSGVLMGSVAAEVVRRLHEPLILVGPQVDLDTVARGDRVVACVGPEGSEQVIAPAAEWAERFAVPLELVTVVEPVLEAVPGQPVRRHHGPAEPVAYLIELAAKYAPLGMLVTTTVVEDPIGVAEGVRAHVREHPPVLVVVGSHQRARIERLVLGDDAADIVHRSPAGVLVVPLL